MISAKKKRVCLGAFAGAHGVKGDAKIKAFTEDPKNIASYGPVETEDGKSTFTLKIVKSLKGEFVVVNAPEIASREDAEALKGKRIFVNHDCLPALAEDEFYLDDLVGLKAIDEADAPMGVVAAVHNFGADDLIELKDIPGVKGVRLIAFTQRNVPSVDLRGQTIRILREAIDLGEGQPEDG